MKKFIPIVFPFVVFYLLFSCTTFISQSDENEVYGYIESDLAKNKNVSNSVRNPSNNHYDFLVGSWATECQKQNRLEGKSRRVFFDFFPNKKMNYVLEIYQDELCQKFVRRLAFRDIVYTATQGSFGINHVVIEQDRSNAKKSVFEPRNGHTSEILVDDPNKNFKGGISFYKDGETFLWGYDPKDTHPIFECLNHISDQGKAYCSRIIRINFAK